MYSRIHRDQRDSDSDSEDADEDQEYEEYTDLEAAEYAERWKDKYYNRRQRRQNCCFWVFIVVGACIFMYHTFSLKTWLIFFRGNYVNVIHDHVRRPKPRFHIH